jgi:hypothetical protein
MLTYADVCITYAILALAYTCAHYGDGLPLPLLMHYCIMKVQAMARGGLARQMVKGRTVTAPEVDLRPVSGLSVFGYRHEPISRLAGTKISVGTKISQI